MRCPIHFRLLGRSEEGRSVTVDVSARGTRFRTVSWRRLRAGDRVEVTLTVPSDSAVAGGGALDLMGVGRITRVEPGADETRLSAGGVAIEFDSPLNLSSVV
jgi:hypothetical protein